MAQRKAGKLIKQRNYCLVELARHDIGNQRRKILEGKLAHITERLAEANACRECGRSLTDPVSKARGVGPECLRKLAVA